MIAVKVFVALCALLVVGKVLRLRIPLLQRMYLPASMVGGFVGLALVSCFPSLIPQDCVQAAGKVPGFLINVVFATIFLGAATPKLKTVLAQAFPQLALGQFIAWGQYVVGLALAGFLFAKLYGVPPAFGNLLEIGFEGGPGTVGGMVESFHFFKWEDGVALGYTMSTVGMIIGIVLGMALVNWAHRRGYVHEVRAFAARRLNERRGLHLRGKRPSAGAQTVCSDSIDSLAWHLAAVGLAIAIGYGLRQLIPMKGFPLFPLCMIGGVLIELTAKICKFDLFLDRVQMERISGAALDFLLVAAIATIKVKVVAAHWQPLLILIVAGTVWTLGCVLFIAPRIFRNFWFERAIAEFGQATGVTATGLMLLRTVDPENRTPAAMSFGYKQLLHEPFMGGGIWTALAFTLVFQIGWVNVFLISLAALVFWLAVVIVLSVRNRRKAVGVFLAVSVLGGLSASAAEIVAAEQAETRYVAIDPAQKDGYVWQWRPKEDKVTAPYGWAFSNPSEVKPRPNGKLLVAASGNGFACIDRKKNAPDFFGVVRSSNLHSIEVLPGGIVAAACSTGSSVALIDVKEHPLEPDKQRQNVSNRLEEAHGVVWFPNRKDLLYAIGKSHIVEYRFNAKALTLTETRRFDFTAAGCGTWGHDMMRDGDDALVFTTVDAIGRLDLKTGKLSLVEARKNVKAYSVRADGVKLYSIPNESWWTDRLITSDGAEIVRPKARFYKARWCDR